MPTPPSEIITSCKCCSVSVTTSTCNIRLSGRFGGGGGGGGGAGGPPPQTHTKNTVDPACIGCSDKRKAIKIKPGP